MAEAVAEERSEISISGKGRLAEEGLTREGGVNIRIHCRSLDEVCFIHFIMTVYLSLAVATHLWSQMKGEAMHAVLEVSSQ